MLSLCSGDANLEQNEGRHPATLADAAGVPRPHCAEWRTRTPTKATAPHLDVELHPATHPTGVQVPPAVVARIEGVQEKVSKGVMTAGCAADILMREFAKPS